MSVSLLVGLVPYRNETNIGIYPVLDVIPYRNFWRHSWVVGTLVPNNSEFLVSLSVYVCVCDQLTKLFNIFGSGRDIFLKSFRDNPAMCLH